MKWVLFVVKFHFNDLENWACIADRKTIESYEIEVSWMILFLWLINLHWKWFGYENVVEGLSWGNWSVVEWIRRCFGMGIWNFLAYNLMFETRTRKSTSKDLKNCFPNLDLRNASVSRERLFLFQFYQNPWSKMIKVTLLLHGQQILRTIGLNFNRGLEGKWLNSVWSLERHNQQFSTT